jgi:CBS domain-containing protein
MEISGTVEALLRDKNPSVWSIESGATVFQAIQMMAEKNIGALPVLRDGTLVGILSERDYTRKVILKGKSSKNTAVEDIMTREIVVVSPEETIANCMRLMTTRRVRHLPIMNDGKMLGIVSIGDLVKWIISQQEATIDQLTKYVFGE